PLEEQIGQLSDLFEEEPQIPEEKPKETIKTETEAFFLEAEQPLEEQIGQLSDLFDEELQIPEEEPKETIKKETETFSFDTEPSQSQEEPRREK
ncbi:MAG: hypothetical protein AB4426_31635, partial [Xenococcaceae cyanobacterium]